MDDINNPFTNPFSPLLPTLPLPLNGPLMPAVAPRRRKPKRRQPAKRKTGRKPTKRKPKKRKATGRKGRKR
ncbi:MAG TPA: hypothetical protein VFC38_01850 [Stellaceae bacterium]|nr:hypothetical protein [Stellaceae bacterium]